MSHLKWVNIMIIMIILWFTSYVSPMPKVNKNYFHVQPNHGRNRTSAWGYALSMMHLCVQNNFDRTFQHSIVTIGQAGADYSMMKCPNFVVQIVQCEYCGAYKCLCLCLSFVEVFWILQTAIASL